MLRLRAGVLACSRERSVRTPIEITTALQRWVIGVLGLRRCGQLALVIAHRARPRSARLSLNRVPDAFNGVAARTPIVGRLCAATIRSAAERQLDLPHGV